MKDLLTSGVENGSAELHPCKYRVVSATQSYTGEIQVGVTFTLKVYIYIFYSCISARCFLFLGFSLLLISRRLKRFCLIEC